MIHVIKKRHIALLSLLALLIVAGILVWRNDQTIAISSTIRPFNQEKDFLTLTTLINKNRFLLSENPDFPTEKFLLWRAPSFDPSKKGQARIDVIEVDGVPAGFVAYYKKSPKAGYIWILAVDQHFRGQGLGNSLMLNALKELKKQGASFATLSTRTINQAALALYKKLGFSEQMRDEDRGIVTLIKHSL